MDILILGSFFYFGVVVAQYFKFQVLVPVVVLAIILVLVSPTHLEPNLLGWGFQIVGVMTSLQLGCVVGLTLHAILRFCNNFEEPLSTLQQKPASGAEEDQASFRLGIELYAPGPPRRRWPGFRSRRLAFDCLSR